MRLLVLVPLLALTGCFFADLSAEADYRQRLARLDAQIVSAIGEARADTVAQCTAIAYGSKACGGPSRVRVFSEVDGNPARVRSLAAEFTALEDEMNRRFRLVSTCEMLLEPVPVLQEGRCVAGPHYVRD